MTTIENEIEIEVWADIKDYEGIYQISNFGIVKSLDRTVVCNIKNVHNRIVKGKIIKTHYDRNGYERIELYSFSIRKIFFIHRLTNTMPTWLWIEYFITTY